MKRQFSHFFTFIICIIAFVTLFVIWIAVPHLRERGETSLFQLGLELHQFSLYCPLLLHQQLDLCQARALSYCILAAFKTTMLIAAL